MKRRRSSWRHSSGLGRMGEKEVCLKDLPDERLKWWVSWWESIPASRPGKVVFRREYDLACRELAYRHRGVDRRSVKRWLERKPEPEPVPTVVKPRRVIRRKRPDALRKIRRVIRHVVS